MSRPKCLTAQQTGVQTVYTLGTEPTLQYNQTFDLKSFLLPLWRPGTHASIFQATRRPSCPTSGLLSFLTSICNLETSFQFSNFPDLTRLGPQQPPPSFSDTPKSCPACFPLSCPHGWLSLSIRVSAKMSPPHRGLSQLPYLEQHPGSSSFKTREMYF